MKLSSSNTILVVDDNLGARKSIEALLTTESYHILLAENGASAIEIAKRRIPDIILLDVMMPGMSGFEVCRIIRSDAKLSEIPIIMITALDDEDSMLQGIEAGADDFLPKPISKIELRSRVKGILRLNRFRKLCDERRKFELVVEQSNFGYIIIDQDFCIQFSNPAAKDLLEVPEYQDIHDANFFELAEKVYSIKPKDIREILSSADDDRRQDPFILVQSKLSGRNVRWLRGTIRDLSDSAPNPLLLKLEDITEQIISFQEKHTFSRMISHKLITPLNALKASSQIMSEIDGEKIERLGMGKVLDLQRQGISRLEYDIQSVLAFLDSNTYSSTKTGGCTILQAVESLKLFEGGAFCDFQLHCSESLDTSSEIGIPLNGFEACAREIVENAVKFKNESPVLIECTIDQYASSDGEAVRFRFANNSKPLGPSELANAWKPYWQADRYYTGEVRGMGLGLSLIATNVWAAGGICKIQNRDYGRGVELTLTFPKIS